MEAKLVSHSKVSVLRNMVSWKHIQKILISYLSYFVIGLVEIPAVSKYFF